MVDLLNDFRESLCDAKVLSIHHSKESRQLKMMLELWNEETAELCFEGVLKTDADTGSEFESFEIEYLHERPQDEFFKAAVQENAQENEPTNWVITDPNDQDVMRIVAQSVSFSSDSPLGPDSE